MTHAPSESEIKALREIVAEHMVSSSGRERTRAGKEDGAYNMNIAKAAFPLGRERVLDVAHEIGCAQCALGEQRVSDGHVGYEHIIDGKHVPCTRKEPQPLSDGWIRYDGKGMPVSGDTTVWAKNLAMRIAGPLHASSIYWGRSNMDGVASQQNIIAYRLDDPAKANDSVCANNARTESIPDPMSRPVTRGELVAFGEKIITAIRAAHKHADDALYDTTPLEMANLIVDELEQVK